MIELIREQLQRWQLRREQWQFHCFRAKLLSDFYLYQYATGGHYNLQFVKACRHELRNRR